MRTFTGVSPERYASGATPQFLLPKPVIWGNLINFNSLMLFPGNEPF